MFCTNPLSVLDEVGAAAALGDPLGEDATVDGLDRLGDHLQRINIIVNIIYFDTTPFSKLWYSTTTFFLF